MKTISKLSRGFTIVELLIVIVVIGILAAISIVAYNGIQVKARDAIRYSDAKTIMQALELYKTEKGYYPVYDVSIVTGAAICGSHTNGYSYSDATDNTWLTPLVTGRYISKVPTPPNNGCSSYYRYLNPGATAYNCPSRTVGYYVLIINGVEGTTTPSDAADPGGSGNWTPCVGATAGWGDGSSEWVFQHDE